MFADYQDHVTKPIVGSDDIRDATLAARKVFVRKVANLVVGQLVVLFVISANIYALTSDSDWLRSHEWMLWISVLVVVTTLFTMICFQQVCRISPVNYILLFVFTTFEGVMVGFVSAMFSWTTLLLVVGIAALAWAGFSIAQSYDLSINNDPLSWKPFALIAACVLCAFGLLLVVLQILGSSPESIIWGFDFGIVMLFSLYAIFDLQLMMGGWGGHLVSFLRDDYCFAALSIYMDTVNIFVHMLSLAGDRKS